MAKKVSKLLAALILFAFITYLFWAKNRVFSSDCETINTSSSGWIEGAKYCNNKKLWLDLGDNVYLYKNVTNGDWLKFKYSESLGRGFHRYIKKSYVHAEKTNGRKGLNDIK